MTEPEALPTVTRDTDGDKQHEIQGPSAYAE